MAKTTITHENPEAGSGIHAAATPAEAEHVGIEPADIKLTFTLSEICDAVGHGVRPGSFAGDAFEEIANQIEAEGTVSASEGGRWQQILSIAARARFAGTVVDMLSTGEVSK